jgi:pseudaminic acid cytidylyltransferase
MPNIAIIPARGGSKRMPGKNIKEFYGKPIIAYSIETAINSGIFDEIMVSTDDDNIAAIAQSYGAKIPFLRSAKNSGDFATTKDVIVEVLNYYTGHGRSFELACCLYPCAPLMKVDYLLKSFENLKEEDIYSSFPIVRYSYPIWRSLKINSEGFIQLNFNENLNSRTQDLPIAYHDAGMFYSFKVNSFLQENGDLFARSKPLILKEVEVQDIDHEIDWKLAELKFKILNEGV